ncbi:MAG: transporter substrate-binding domain-containing protein [Acidimicrobiaceae bacterium]|nr:transporter substrate-binding domain-containing protein [Acidimicrobiaceae bacterium]MCY4280130.1 transporter substrate-binding domain-containing protein [Acidimicrobiaceae bacterium]MCY4294732.1 transporter substrate-binding domain-containing protein [Acidimicrobiaceae bacterium]
MQVWQRHARVGLGALLACATLLTASGCSSTQDAPQQRTVSVGFYAFFEPVSRAADPEPGTEGFDVHVGYEADLLSAVEAMEDIGLSFERRGIGPWENIWLEPATEDTDLVGGGITILESRTVDATGDTVVAFTDGHIEFRQSLLVRAEDAGRLRDHDSLNGDDVVAALPNTTGEARLLQLIGAVDASGGLREGTRIKTPAGEVVVASDGEVNITASGASPELKRRLRLIPADPNRPQVLYLGDDQGDPLGEAALHAALSEGRVDAVSGAVIGNSQAAAASQGEFAVTAFDDLIEHGGFVVDVDDADLLERMNTALDWLTDNGRIGFTDWLADSEIFMARAAQWPSPEPS